MNDVVREAGMIWMRLKAWFEHNAERFALAPRVSFRHLYFSPDRRGPAARADAERALAQLIRAPDDVAVIALLADPFMFQEYYGDRSPEQLAKLFGLGDGRDDRAADAGGGR